MGCQKCIAVAVSRLKHTGVARVSHFVHLIVLHIHLTCILWFWNCLKNVIKAEIVSPVLKVLGIRTCTCSRPLIVTHVSLMRLWYRSPFLFSPKASSYLVFSWPPRLYQNYGNWVSWPLGELDRISIWKWCLFVCLFFAISTAIIPVRFIIIKDKWINNLIVSQCYNIVRLLLLYKVYPLLASFPFCPTCLCHYTCTRLGPGLGGVGVYLVSLQGGQCFK